MTKKFLLLFLILLPFNSIAQEKKTTFNEELFKKAQSDGKIVLVSSWIEYCYSCASQMKVLDKAKKEFENVEYFAFDVTNKEISSLFNVQYQSTILIFKDNKEIHRSIGITNKDEIYKIIKSYI
jgi:thioredoxin 1